MNKRIRELAEQAGMTNDKFGMFFAKDKHDEDGVDLEKFAQLIVEECIVIMNREIDEEESKEKNRTISDMMDLLEKHFGVAE